MASGWGVGGCCGAFTLTMFICCAGCGFVEVTAGFEAGAEKARFSKTARSVATAIAGVGVENAAPGTGAGLITGLRLDLTSDLAANFEIGFGELRLGVELAGRFRATLGLDLESDFAVWAVGADCFWKCSGPELDMDDASFAPKLEDMDDNDGDWVEAGATGAVTGMRAASTRIGVPRVRLHSMHQWREL